MKFNLIKSSILLGTLTFASVAHAAYTTYKEALSAARIPFNQGDYVGAQPKLEEALVLAKTPAEKVDGLTHLGLVYARQKMYDKAREQWNKILQMPDATGEDKIGAHNVIAASYAEQEKGDEARAEFQKILESPDASADDKVSAHLSIGFTLLGRGEEQSELARQQFLIVAEDASLDADARGSAYAQVGQSYRDEDKPSEARAIFNKALAIPGIPISLKSQLYGAIAETYKSQGDAQQTQRAFQTAQALGLAAAQQATENKDWAAAIALHEQVLSFGDVNPTIDAASRSSIGSLLFEEKKYAEGRAKLEEFLQKKYEGLGAAQQIALGSLQQRALVDIADSYMDENESAKAREVLQRLLARPDISPGFKKTGEEMLASLKNG